MVDDLDVVRVTAEMEMDGVEDVQNVYHVLKVSGGPVTDTVFMDDMAAQLESMYLTFVARQITSYTYNQITGQQVFGGSDIMPDVAWPTIIAGLSTSDALPLQVTALVAGQTTSSKKQGRKYLGGFTELDNVNGVVQPGLTSALANYALEWITDFVSGAHTYRFGVFNVLSSVFTPFVASLILGAFRTQRRRTAGFGS